MIIVVLNVINIESATNTGDSNILAKIHILSLKLLNFHFPILQLNGTGRSHIIRYPSANNTEDEASLNNAWIKVLMIKMRAVLVLSKCKGLFYLYINMLIVICNLLIMKISLIKMRSYDRGCLSIFKPNKVVLKSKCHPIALQVKNKRGPTKFDC